MAKRIELLKKDIAAERAQLIHHPLYGAIRSAEHLMIFMQHHVFAVWDFMSLLKSLQQQLTCTTVPWVPKGNAETRYLINEIVTGEECDVDPAGNRMSHFELYIAGMKQIGCRTEQIENFISSIEKGSSVSDALHLCGAPRPVADFVTNTFEVINSQPVHVQASVFTMGREDIIPGMFVSFVRELNRQTADKAAIFEYYLERHIEVDGDHHSQLAASMTAHLCGDSEENWLQATTAVRTSLQARIILWDSILEQIAKPVK